MTQLPAPLKVLRIFFYVALVVLWFVLAFNLAGCQYFSSKVYTRSPLAGQFLKPRKGFTGLTNRVCLEYKFSKCVRDEVKNYDLNDEHLRRTLNDFGFICDLAGKRFKVCKDKAGFCRFDGECIKWRRSLFGRQKGCKEWSKREVFVPVTNYQYLLDSGLYCTAIR